MYTLRKEKITGRIIIQIKENEMKSVERQKLKEILEKELEKEIDVTRKDDYQILRNSIMGVKAILLKKKVIEVFFSSNFDWKIEGDALISNNNKLFQILKGVYDNPPKKEIKKDI